jgi:arylsulfatase A-like enzyme
MTSSTLASPIMALARSGRKYAVQTDVHSVQLQPVHLGDLVPTILTACGLPVDERPRFLFAHFYDVHGDWQKKGNKLSYYSPPEYRTDLEVPESATCSAKGGCAIRFLMRFGQSEKPIAPEFAALHFELYRRGARTLDAELAGFFDQLRRARLWDDALVVVTGDHGEEFGEHGKFTHVQIFRETLRVPLLVKLPRAERGGTRESRPVVLEDIAPTLLNRAGIAPPRELLGFDLLAAPRTGAQRPLLARQTARFERFALRLGARLLVRNRESGERRLFDLAADPLELAELPVGSATTAELEALDQRLDSVLRTLRAGRREPVSAGGTPDAAEEADLRALGYLD